MNKYVSKIDGKVFETKEELMKHLESTYVYEEANEDLEYSNILSKLKEAFPEADAQITEFQNGRYYVELTFDLGSFSETLNFTVKEDDELATYSTIEEAIDFYKHYPMQTELIRETLADRYNLDSFEVDQWVVSDKWDSYGHHICLNVTLNGIEMYLESGIKEDIEHFIQKEVEINFKTEFEGALTQDYHGWSVDGVNLNRILDRARKIKITILE